MKIEEYECVKIKRRAQARIFEETKDLTPEQLVTRYERIGATARLRDAGEEVRAPSTGQIGT